MEGGIFVDERGGETLRRMSEGDERGGKVRGEFLREVRRRLGGRRVGWLL